MSRNSLDDVPRPRTDWGRVADGVGLAGLGVFFLVATVRGLPDGFWMEAISFWPVLLVSAGIRIVFEKTPLAAGMILGPLVVVGTLFWLAWGDAPQIRPPGEWQALSADRPPGVERARVDAELAGVHVGLESRPLGPGPLRILGRCNGNSSSATATVTVQDVTPPELIVPDDMTVGMQTAAGAEVALTATAEDTCDADVEISSDEPEVFPLGATTVTFAAVDDSGNSTSGSMTVTVQGPAEIKADAENCLSGHADESRWLGIAADYIDKSLNAEYWIDETHLDSKTGHKVFNYERSAVVKLMWLLRNDKRNPLSDEARECAESALEKMVRVDRILAEIVIAEAEEAEVPDRKLRHFNKRVARVKEEMKKGDLSRDAGRFDKAITRYRNAWKHACYALRLTE